MKLFDRLSGKRRLAASEREEEENKKSEAARAEAERKANAARAEAERLADLDENGTPPGYSERLGDNYFLAYEEVSNNMGGYHAVNCCLYHGGRLIRQITNGAGYFLDFPGVEHGDWEKNLTGALLPAVSFASGCSTFGEDGLALFWWMVQPDGRYWADEDGFGMENDEEVTLYSKIDKTGHFVRPFGKQR